MVASSDNSASPTSFEANPYAPPASDFAPPPATIRLECGLFVGPPSGAPERTNDAVFHLHTGTLSIIAEPGNLRLLTHDAVLALMLGVLPTQYAGLVLVAPLVHALLYATAVLRYGFKVIIPLSSHRLYADRDSRCLGVCGMRGTKSIFLGFRVTDDHDWEEICRQAPNLATWPIHPHRQKLAATAIFLIIAVMVYVAVARSF